MVQPKETTIRIKLSAEAETQRSFRRINRRKLLRKERNTQKRKNLKSIKEIDVIWFTKDNITHEFEVENTTGIWSAIIRGSNIPNDKVKRFIVIPEERQETFYNKINVPALKGKVQKENWRFILYDDLKSFFHKIRMKRKINAEEFEKIAQKPKMPKKKLKTLEQFI